VAKGAYVLSTDSQPQVVLMATGSELSLAVEAAKMLRSENRLKVRVVSVPSTTVFDQQSQDYKASVLPAGVPRVVVEAGVTDFWWKYQPAAVVGLDRFGESAPAPDVYKHFEITALAVANTARRALALKNSK
jgi:transketolase